MNLYAINFVVTRYFSDNPIQEEKQVIVESDAVSTHKLVDYLGVSYKKYMNLKDSITYLKHSIGHTIALEILNDHLNSLKIGGFDLVEVWEGLISLTEYTPEYQKVIIKHT